MCHGRLGCKEDQDAVFDGETFIVDVAVIADYCLSSLNVTSFECFYGIENSPALLNCLRAGFHLEFGVFHGQVPDGAC